MPPDDKQPVSNVRTARLIEGTGPRKGSPKAWDPSKPPGGKLPPEAKSQAKTADELPQ